MKKILFLLPLVFIAFTCENEDDYSGSPEEINLVTGVFIRDQLGAPLNPTTGKFDEKNNKLGNPNVKTGATFIYPNPGKSQVFVYSDQKVKKMWLMKGLKINGFRQTDFSNLLANVQYTITDITADDEREFIPNSASFAVKIDDFSAGYYRVFYQLENDSIRWDNLYIHQEEDFSKGLNKIKRDWD